MKIGIHNIYLSFVLLLLISCGGILLRFIIMDNVSIPKLLYVSIIISFLVVLGILAAIFCKFRIFTVSDAGIVCFYPFLLKQRKLKWKELKKVNFKIYDSFWSKSVIREVYLNSNQTTLTFSDLEFENFQTLVCHLPQGETLLQEINLSYKQEISKFDVIAQISFGILSIILLHYILFIKIFWAVIIVIPLLYASIKRIVEFIKIKKHNPY